MTLASLIWMIAAVLLQQPAAAPTAPSKPDFEFFRTRVQPIFLAKRPGHARCYSCHSQNNVMSLQRLAPGTTMWDEAQARRNFESVRVLVNSADPLKSRLLMHPLALEAGGNLFHNGGKHWDSQSAPEWQTLLAFARGETLSGSGR